jgi:hypothetical protein
VKELPRVPGKPDLDWDWKLDKKLASVMENMLPETVWTVNVLAPWSLKVGHVPLDFFWQKGENVTVVW